MLPGSISNTASTLGIYAIQPPRPGNPPAHDPKDGNRDGLVSFGEAWTYSLKHPEIKIIKELRFAKEPVLSSEQKPTVRTPSPLPFGSNAPQSSARVGTMGNLDLLA